MALRGSISNTITAGAANITLSMTAGWTSSPPQVNDLIILQMSVNVTSGSFAVSGSAFSAIPSVSNMNVVSANGTCTLGAQYRVCTGTEGTITVTTSGTNFYTVTARAYSGRASSPFTVTPATTSPVGVGGGSPQSLSLTGLTANANDDLCLLIGTNITTGGAETWSLTPPSGYGNTIVEYGAGSTNSLVIQSCDKLNVSAGATGTLSASMANTAGLGMAYGGYLLSLAAGSTGPPPVSPQGPMPRQIYIMP